MYALVDFAIIQKKNVYAAWALYKINAWIDAMEPSKTEEEPPHHRGGLPVLEAEGEVFHKIIDTWVQVFLTSQPNHYFSILLLKKSKTAR
ncbi:hypothetical protein FA048_12585 [Pedobacter polaris]|uniref:Uncharacterized protein n=1 Tax=Pedobacter polaris TaxID=2571273 RepID=A0A4V5P1R4_9SPHI|nr:hypothetical protein [Pedobacter polaris]TKC07995.1 hypothetical protein FA048_12585 [Pedobacter polaris]